MYKEYDICVVTMDTKGIEGTPMMLPAMCTVIKNVLTYCRTIPSTNIYVLYNVHVLLRTVVKTTYS